MENNRIQSCFARHECKFALTEEQYEAMCAGIGPRMRPDEHHRYTITNLYYDTDTYRLIRASLEKPDYKEKLRLRSYGCVGEEDRVFLEMKKKYDGVVFKRRIVLSAREAAAYLEDGVMPEKDSQILREIDYFRRFYTLSPKAYIAYEREAWSGIEEKELRLTFDRDLRWRADALDLRLDAPNQPLGEKDMILMEIKTPDSIPIWLTRLTDSLAIRRISFSKYGECYKENFLPRLSRSLRRSPEPDVRTGNLYAPFAFGRGAASGIA